MCSEEGCDRQRNESFPETLRCVKLEDDQSAHVGVWGMQGTDGPERDGEEFL